MPTGLQTSRNFMSRGIAAVRAGVEGVRKGSAQEGLAIGVDPFGPGNVSTAAGLAKVATTILAARRQRANYEAAQEDVAIAREKSRAEIARIRAEGEYYLGQGRQTTQPRPTTGLPPAPVTLPAKFGNLEPGQYDPRVVNFENQRLNREAVSNRVAARAASAQHYAAAKSAQSGLDAERERQIVSGEAIMRRKVNGLFGDVKTGGTKKDAAVAALGYDPTNLEDPGSAQAHKQALDALFSAFRARKYAEFEALPEVQRRRRELRSVMEREGGVLAAPAPAEATAPTPNADTIIEYDAEGNPIPAGP